MFTQKRNTPAFLLCIPKAFARIVLYGCRAALRANVENITQQIDPVSSPVDVHASAVLPEDLLGNGELGVGRAGIDEAHAERTPRLRGQGLRVSFPRGFDEAGDLGRRGFDGTCVGADTACGHIAVVRRSFLRVEQRAGSGGRCGQRRGGVLGLCCEVRWHVVIGICGESMFHGERYFLG